MATAGCFPSIRSSATSSWFATARDGLRMRRPSLKRATSRTSRSSLRSSRRPTPRVSPLRVRLSTGSPYGQLADLRRRKLTKSPRRKPPPRETRKRTTRRFPSKRGGNPKGRELLPALLLTQGGLYSMNNELSPVEKVLDRLEDYKERRGEFRARCPAHQGNSEDSLSIREGDNGRALLTCHAGCDLQDIVGALGLGVVDLFPHNGRASRSSLGTAKKVAKKTTQKTDKGKEETLTTDDLPDGTYYEFTSPAGEVLYIQRHKG